MLEKGRLRTLSSRSKSRKFELSSKERNRNVYVGCIVHSYNISRRGLTRVACPKREAMRETGTWDKREVVTPTSFILTETIKPKLGMSTGIFSYEKE